MRKRIEREEEKRKACRMKELYKKDKQKRKGANRDKGEKGTE